MARLTGDELEAFLAGHAGWKVEGGQLERTFRFPDFGRAMGFVTQAALLAEKENHHPDIGIRWNLVTLRLSTHSEGGITEKDCALAAGLDRLAG